MVHSIKYVYITLMILIYINVVQLAHSKKMSKSFYLVLADV
jgi:hypothetical protein